MAEVVDQRAPPGRVDVLGAGDDDARIGVDLEHVGFDDEEPAGGVGLDPGGTGLQLQGAFGDPGRPDEFGGLGPQACGRELVPLEPEGVLLVRGYGGAPGERRESFDRRPLGRLGQVDHQLGSAAEVVRGLRLGPHAEDDHLAKGPGRGHRREVGGAVPVLR